METNNLNRWKLIHTVTAVFAIIIAATPVGAAGGKTDNKSKIYEREQILVIGKTSRNPKKHYKYLMPIANYAAEQMRNVGIRKARVVLVKNNDQLISYLEEGRVDWISETPFGSVVFTDKAGAEILVRRWKKGVPDYHTVFITRKDSHIRSINDLAGHTIAFEDPESTSAFLVPYYTIARKGLSLVPMETIRKKPASGKVGYIFAGQEINMSTWLHKRLVNAAAYSNLDWIKKDHTPLAFKKDFFIFHRTHPFPRAIEMVRKDLNPDIKNRLKRILLEAHNDPDAKDALRAYQRTTKFDELDEAALAGLEETRRILTYVENVME